MKMGKRSSPQISEDMVSLHNMASPQSGDTRAGRPLSDATGPTKHFNPTLFNHDNSNTYAFDQYSSTAYEII